MKRQENPENAQRFEVLCEEMRSHYTHLITQAMQRGDCRRRKKY